MCLGRKLPENGAVEILWKAALKKGLYLQPLKFYMERRLILPGDSGGIRPEAAPFLS